jgi:hypothetical protein
MRCAVSCWKNCKDALVDSPSAMRVIPAEDPSVKLFRDSAAALGRLLRSTENTSTAAKRPRNAAPPKASTLRWWPGV